MNEHERFGQLSALFDGELPAEQAGLVIRRAVKDRGMRDHWERYALIGACLRNEPLVAPGRLSVADRVAVRLDTEPELLVLSQSAARTAVPPASTRYGGLFGRGALGGAIAASVALVCVVAVRYISPIAGDAGLVAGTVAPTAVQTAADLDAAPSYTTPIDTSPVSQSIDRSLVNYVVAHSEVASSGFRLSPVSAGVDGSYDPTIGTVEMTADQIGARR